MKISGKTRLIGLLGDPINHSLSPAMHNLSFDDKAEDYVYLCLPTGKDRLKESLEALKNFGAKGSNITYPNKIEILKYLDRESEEVKLIGSCNTLLIDDNKKVMGYNTDGKGFVKSLEENNIDFKNKKIAIMGCGGAGSAIITALLMAGAEEILVKEIDLEKAENFKKKILTFIPNAKIIIAKNEKDFGEKLEKGSLLINATPCGMAKNEKIFPLNPEILEGKDLILYDIIYSPLESPLIKKCKEYGYKTFNGINMMINQGAISFKIWTGKDMDIAKVKKEILKLIEN